MNSVEKQGSLLLVSALVALPALLGVWAIVELITFIIGLGNIGTTILYLCLVLIIFFLLNVIVGIVEGD